MRQPDVMLTEIHRQAGESAILRLATHGTAGHANSLRSLTTSYVWKMRRTDVAPEQLLRGDQVICGRNATRLHLNVAMKHAAGFTGAHPVGGGEKIICLKNRQRPRPGQRHVRLARRYPRRRDRSSSMPRSRPRTAWQIAGRHRFYKGHFDDHVHLDPERSRRDWKAMRGLIETVWGYAITCHKAQGSVLAQRHRLRRRSRPHRGGSGALALHRNHARRAGARDP